MTCLDNDQFYKTMQNTTNIRVLLWKYNLSHSCGKMKVNGPIAIFGFPSKLWRAINQIHGCKIHSLIRNVIVFCSYLKWRVAIVPNSFNKDYLYFNNICSYSKAGIITSYKQETAEISRASMPLCPKDRPMQFFLSSSFCFLQPIQQNLSLRSGRGRPFHSAILCFMVVGRPMPFNI